MKSSYIDIPADIAEKLGEDDEDEKNSNILTAWVKFSGLQIKDGDCLIVNRNGYRNDGKFLWDDQKRKVIPLAFDLDEYGCIPKDFDLRRFPAQFFSFILDHNSFVRLENDFIRQIVDHAEFSHPPVGLNMPENPIVWSYFMFGKTKYYVIGIPSDAKYAQQKVIEENQGQLYIEHGDMRKLKKDSLEYAVNFMRVFIDNVKGERIDFLDTSSNKEYDKNCLFVQC